MTRPTRTPTADREARPETDAELLLRHRRGDREAFDRLVRRWEGPVFRVAYRVLGDRNDAEEARQEVFLRLLRSPGTIRHEDRFAAWAHRATVNASLSMARARRRRAGLLDRFRLRSRLGDLVTTADPTGEAASLRDEAAWLREALAGLAPEDRALLALRFEEDLTFREIAEATGRPASTVKSRLAILIERLRARLGGPDRDG